MTLKPGQLNRNLEISCSKFVIVVKLREHNIMMIDHRKNIIFQTRLNGEEVLKRLGVADLNCSTTSSSSASQLTIGQFLVCYLHIIRYYNRYLPVSDPFI